IFDKQPVASIGALAVAPSDPNVIYAGTGESDIRSDLASGNGVYKSTDAGKTWRFVGLKDTRQISRIVIDPRQPRTVLVAALGHAYGPNPERGVYRSTNGGETWEQVLDRGPDIGAADLTLAARKPDLVFATMWEAHRPPWSVYAPSEGQGSGLFRSRDGGKTWSQLLGHGLPEGKWGRAGVTVSPEGQRVYVLIDAAKESGLYRSDDGGDTWTLANSDSRLTGRAWYFSCPTIDPNDPDVVYIPNVAFYKLSGGGKNLSIVRGAPGGDDYHQVWIDPADSRHMVLGVDQGTTVTLNGGATWSTWYNQPTAQLYHAATDNEFPYHVYGAQQDSGTAAIASRTDHGMIDARDFFTVGGSESGYIAPDPKDPDIFYISGTYGTLVRFNRRLMQSQNIAPSAATASLTTPISEQEFRDPWTPVVVFSPAQPNALYFGTQYVMRTLDGGMHWQTISPDLTGAVKGLPSSASPATIENAKERGYGVVYTIAPSPLNAAEIWAGSDTGLVHLTRDGGKSWTNVTPNGLSPWSKISLIEASHFNQAEAYAAIDRHRLDDQQPYLFRTRDYGKSWQPISEGIAENAFLRCIREDPKHRGLLFAGTELGVYVSFDDGDHWQSLQLNLPVTSVPDLVIHGDDLVAATHGRSFWILDNIAPLREIADHAGSDAARLYKPAVAYRSKHDLFLGTPLPPEEPQALNPPEGASIDYYLPEGSAGEATLDILDASGQLVRHYSSSDPPLPEPEAPAIASRWLPKPQQLSNSPGMHRFVWDLRYGRKGEITTDDPEGTGLETWIGPLAVPGTYKASLTVNGNSLVQTFQIVMDPRSKATQAELLTQLQWAQRAFNDLIAARQAASKINDVEHRLSDESHDRALKKIAEGFNSLTEAFTFALNAIESADRAPTSQAIQLYQDSAKLLHSRLVEWNSFEQTLLPRPHQQ
ncbi:MAG TPA: hypothetical protein VFA65_07540, partial [Bryobacteraceae bacterium]|nr:hypothetical protein [Bryobacteraceae bacterium]